MDSGAACNLCGTCDDVLDGAVFPLPHLRRHLPPLQLCDQVRRRRFGHRRNLKQQTQNLPFSWAGSLHSGFQFINTYFSSSFLYFSTNKRSFEVQKSSGSKLYLQLVDKYNFKILSLFGSRSTGLNMNEFHFKVDAFIKLKMCVVGKFVQKSTRQQTVELCHLIGFFP